MVTPKLITAPTVDPLGLSEIKSHLRITWDDEDDKLNSFAACARDEFEDLTGRTLHETTWEYRLRFWPGGYVSLPRAAPLISVVSIKYLDSTGLETTWGSSLYIVDTPGDAELGRVATAYGESFPTFTPYPINPIRIQYKTGIANSSPQNHVSERIKTCLLLMIGGLWEHREEYVLPERSVASMVFAANPVVQRMIAGLRVRYVC